jgi:hypothetical protein
MPAALMSGDPSFSDELHTESKWTAGTAVGASVAVRVSLTEPSMGLICLKQGTLPRNRRCHHFRIMLAFLGDLPM